jgi:hypothetical protein
MHRALPLLLLALACSAPAPEPMPSPIALTPDTRELMLGRKWMGHREIWMDSVTKVANVYFQGENAPFEPYGPDLYLSFYFAGIWSEGQVTVRDLERTLMANHDDSVLVAIDAPPNDPGGHYYVILGPSTGPRTHHRTLMRVGADGPDLFNLVLNVTFWGETKDRNQRHEEWLRDSSQFWAAELGRLKLDRRWRGRFLTPVAME